MNSFKENLILTSNKEFFGNLDYRLVQRMYRTESRAGSPLIAISGAVVIMLPEIFIYGVFNGNFHHRNIPYFPLLFVAVAAALVVAVIVAFVLHCTSLRDRIEHPEVIALIKSVSDKELNDQLRIAKRRA
jgi:hypothetical protein